MVDEKLSYVDDEYELAEVLELMERRRRQLHVHSVAYYHLDMSFVDDAVYDSWSKELARLNYAHPVLKELGDKADLFYDWTGETGMHLPETDDTLRVINSLRRAA